MKKFFSANNWDKEESILSFASTSRRSNNDTSATKKAKKKKNKKPSKGPLAPKPTVPTQKTKAKPQNKQNKILQGRITKPEKKSKNKNKLSKALENISDSKECVSSFESRLKENLMGGRFRFINEQLYTMDSASANNLFKEDESAFEAYHEGYRSQVEKWPINPLNKIIKSVRKLPKDCVIGDFGCGEGKLAQSIPNKVFSIDLVACRKDIIASDMAHTPLETQSLNVAVYCLSLMGTNLNDYLLEANRCLKMNGLLLIAEIESRFEDVRQFIKSVEACGFELGKKDTSVKLFIFFEFKKVKNVGKDANLKPFFLKPCVYRKR